MGKPVMQWQILSKNPESSATFYSKLFDWKVNADNPLGYRMIDTGSKRGINGGIWPSPPDGHAFVQLFVEVDDMSATVKKATGLGAKVLIPPQTLPGGDELAILHDPEGIPLGIYRPAK